jgi:hypothetical protein
MVTGEDHISADGCSPSARAGDDGIGLRHHRVDQPESAALTGDRGVDAHRCHRGGPKQVDREPRGLELGIAGVTFEDMAEDAADVVAADRLTPRATSDGLRHEGVAIGNEECRRQLARRWCVGRAFLGGHRNRRYRPSSSKN